MKARLRAEDNNQITAHEIAMAILMKNNNNDEKIKLNDLKPNN